MIPEITLERIKGACDPAEPVVTETKAGANGRREKIVIRMCGDREIARNARMSAVEGLREARAEIAQEQDIPASIKAQLLADLEAQVARIQSSAD
jgi:hypothetical protein